MFCLRIKVKDKSSAPYSTAKWTKSTQNIKLSSKVKWTKWVNTSSNQCPTTKATTKDPVAKATATAEATETKETATNNKLAKNGFHPKKMIPSQNHTMPEEAKLTKIASKAKQK